MLSNSSTEITTVGCSEGGTDLFIDDSGAYKLTGNIDDLNDYGNDWISVRGRILPQIGNPPQNLEVLSITKVSEPRDAVLDPILGNPSGWQSYSNETLGVRFAFPKKFDPISENIDMYELRPNFIKNDHAIDLTRSNIPRETYLPRPYPGYKRTRLQLQNPPWSTFTGGAFGVFVNSQITDAATCKQFNADISDGDMSSRTVDGINYTVNRTSFPGAGNGEDNDSFHTFQNGRCFEVDIDIGSTGSGGADITCALEYADGDALETLLLSKISFFQPKAAAAATGH
jgi:hypothetical protein